MSESAGIHRAPASCRCLLKYLLLSSAPPSHRGNGDTKGGITGQLERYIFQFGFINHLLCDLKQIASPLWASISYLWRGRGGRNDSNIPPKQSLFGKHLFMIPMQSGAQKLPAAFCSPWASVFLSFQQNFMSANAPTPILPCSRAGGLLPPYTPEPFLIITT